MKNTLRLCLCTTILLLGLSGPAAAQERSWEVIEHASWPVWAADTYWQFESRGVVDLVVMGEDGEWRAPTPEELESTVESLDPEGPKVGDFVKPGDVVGVIVGPIDPIPETLIIAVIAAVLGTLVGTAFGAWLYRRLGQERES